MVKTKFKKAVSLMLAAVMSLTAFMGIGATTAFAAVGEKADVYLVDYPRSGDTNNNGEWGHGNLNYMNGWKGLSTKYTGLRAMGSYSGNIAYCIEPGTGQRTGDTLTEKDENFFNNISPNGTISGDDIRLLIGRILQYGYRGGISTSWKSQNESDANCIAHAYATQILIWETIVGERDASFNHVSTGGYNAVLECVSSAHPLRSKILSYYNSMVTSVQNHTKVPSFCTRSSGSAKVNELEWNGSKYVANGVQWFRDRGQWADGSYEPSPGTIIFFDWEGDGVTDHTGIVQKCENGTVYTVEGNSGDTCRTKTYTVGSSVIYGYGIPAY